MATTISGYPYSRVPLNNVTPFTYRDGTTFQEELHTIKNFVGIDLINQINDAFAVTSNEVNVTLEEFSEKVVENSENHFAEIKRRADAVQAIVDAINVKTGVPNIEYVSLVNNLEWSIPET